MIRIASSDQSISEVSRVRSKPLENKNIFSNVLSHPPTLSSSKSMSMTTSERDLVKLCQEKLNDNNITYQETLDIIDQSLKKFPKSIELLLLKADTAYQAGAEEPPQSSADDPKKIYQEALAIDKNNPLANKAIAQYIDNLEGDTKTALTHYKVAAKAIGVDDVMFFTDYAAALEKTNEKGDGIKMLKSIQDSTKDVGLKNKYEKAITHLQ
ncbi:tetratricopeptide repeat protein [Agarilytica rhodophyticola]|uniref:tetratricopeptide repeat protein n=1 Tax=Agarilytica rhodophyticola TaxID=1737490 RepID=UPI000B3482E6|nr:hypothetical protein [Agarilytica rhodophyticola]